MANAFGFSHMWEKGNRRGVGAISTGSVGELGWVSWSIGLVPEDYIAVLWRNVWSFGGKELYLQHNYKSQLTFRYYDRKANYRGW